MKFSIPRRKTGSILVGVLWIQVILTVIVVGLLHSTRVDLHVSKAQSDKVKAYYLALAGAEKAKAVLYQSRKQRMEEGINHKNDIYRDVEQFKETEFGGGQFRIGYFPPVAAQVPRNEPVLMARGDGASWAGQEPGNRTGVPPEQQGPAGKGHQASV